MSYSNSRIGEVAEILKTRLKKLENKADVLRAVEFKALYAQIPSLPASERGAFGKELNNLKTELTGLVESYQLSATSHQLPPIDVTAPFDVNTPLDKRPYLLSAELSSQHPLMTELEEHIDIFARMGFVHMDARELDDDWHMFTSLNFPEEHPARDDYDTFLTNTRDANGKPFVAPAHVSTMQNRLQKKYRSNLDEGRPIAVVYTGRTFRNEDVDARHEHTFYQVEISYIDKNVNVGNLIATIQVWLSNYFKKDVKVKTQPFYFPFTEPSFEFAAGCIFCNQKGCNICSYSGWIELGGCGLIHHNVLEMGGIDPQKFSGFAGGFGVERMAMLKHGIEDVRHFHSGKLDFLRQFK